MSKTYKFGVATLTSLAATAAMGMSATSAQAAEAGEARGCTWYHYESTRWTNYWEKSYGSQVNLGFWKKIDPKSRLKTTVPFEGRSRTIMKFEHWGGSWKNVSDSKGRYPYVERKSVRYIGCS